MQSAARPPIAGIAAGPARFAPLVGVIPRCRPSRPSIHRPELEMPRVRKWWTRHGNPFYAGDEASDISDRPEA